MELCLGILRVQETNVVRSTNFSALSPLAAIKVVCKRKDRSHLVCQFYRKLHSILTCSGKAGSSMMTDALANPRLSNLAPVCSAMRGLPLDAATLDVVKLVVFDPVGHSLSRPPRFA